MVVLEAMKMENPVKAHKAGTVTGLATEAGAGSVGARDEDAEGWAGGGLLPLPGASRGASVVSGSSDSWRTEEERRGEVSVEAIEEG